MEQLPELLIGGIPIILIVFAIVEEVKAWGVDGNILRVVSIVVGFALAVLAQLQGGLPTDLSGWLVTVVYGVIYGLSASGAYDFMKARIAKLG